MPIANNTRARYVSKDCCQYQSTASDSAKKITLCPVSNVLNARIFPLPKKANANRLPQRNNGIKAKVSAQVALFNPRKIEGLNLSMRKITKIDRAAPINPAIIDWVPIVRDTRAFLAAKKVLALVKPNTPKLADMTMIVMTKAYTPLPSGPITRAITIETASPEAIAINLKMRDASADFMKRMLTSFS